MEVKKRYDSDGCLSRAAEDALGSAQKVLDELHYFH